MKSINIKYDDAVHLASFIKETYFASNGTGKLPSNDTPILKIDKNDLIYKVINGMEEYYDHIKLKNEMVIDGNLKMRIHSIDANCLQLKVSSLYCIEQNNLYSFY